MQISIQLYRGLEQHRRTCVQERTQSFH
jgi:hypothetical protein